MWPSAFSDGVLTALSGAENQPPAGGGVPVGPSELGSRTGGVIRHTAGVSGLKIGYARVSTEAQALTAQGSALVALKMAVEQIYVDHGLMGTNGARLGCVKLAPAVAATLRSSPSWIGSPDRCAMLATSSMELVPGAAHDGIRWPVDGRLGSTR